MFLAFLCISKKKRLAIIYIFNINILQTRTVVSKACNNILLSTPYQRTFEFFFSVFRQSLRAGRSKTFNYATTLLNISHKASQIRIRMFAYAKLREFYKLPCPTGQIFSDKFSTGNVRYDLRDCYLAWV